MFSDFTIQISIKKELINFSQYIVTTVTKATSEG